MTSVAISLLGVDKLTDENYTSWKNTINTVLVINNIKLVLMKDCPPVLGHTASRNVHDAYEKWIKANDKALVYILASLTEVLAKKHKTTITTPEIMESLHGMLGQQSSQLKHDASSSSSTLGRMRDHLLRNMFLI
ncbi:uncharacterized protein LOC120076149 [Benincasa hispida]|uniref:uncharacterized protein LOC120076149 n=1 Tax=Benincasa hispida TaxID=102211 RepID=UPI0019027AA9|nr:uncharacterized protein LOC120076149 [Benincasa hispida]